jgi:predicted nucleic acid-binding protein
VNYLIDTDWIVDWLKGTAAATTLLQSLATSGAFAISIISYGEVYEGIYCGTNPAAYEGVFRSFLRGVTVLPLSRATMQEFARTRGQLRQGGNLIPDADLLIAATALQRNLTLVTRNKRHFARVPGLVLH